MHGVTIAPAPDQTLCMQQNLKLVGGRAGRKMPGERERERKKRKSVRERGVEGKDPPALTRRCARSTTSKGEVRLGHFHSSPSASPHTHPPTKKRKKKKEKKKKRKKEG